ncbi:MAG: aminotransferase, partial [Pseudonocardiaceae bacterium]
MAELNGVPADLDQLTALGLTNYGHFTSMRVDDQRVRGLPFHLQRLMRDCRRVFDADLDPDRIRYFVRHALVDVSRPVVVRMTVFDP